MIHDALAILYMGIWYVMPLVTGIFCIRECLAMRHDRPGALSIQTKEEKRNHYKTCRYSEEQVDAEIAKSRCEAEHPNPKEYVKDMRDYIAKIVGGLLFSLSCFCFVLCPIPGFAILAIVGICGIFTSVMIGWAIAYMYYFLNQLYYWYTVKGAS